MIAKKIVFGENDVILNNMDETVKSNFERNRTNIIKSIIVCKTQEEINKKNDGNVNEFYDTIESKASKPNTHLSDNKNLEEINENNKVNKDHNSEANDEAIMIRISNAANSKQVRMNSLEEEKVKSPHDNVGEDKKSINVERKKWVIPKEGNIFEIARNIEEDKTDIRLNENNLEPIKEESFDKKVIHEESKGETFNIEEDKNANMEMNDEYNDVELDPEDLEREDLSHSSIDASFSRDDDQDQILLSPDDKQINGFTEVDIATKLEEGFELDKSNIKVMKRLGVEGNVYLGKIITTNTFVALKQTMLKLNSTDTKTELRTIVNEVEMVKGLNHPNVIKYIGLRRGIYDNAQNSIEYDIIMEYMGKCSLADELKHQSKGLLRITIQKILRQVLKGLEYIHSQGIIHRNLKPSNILCDRKGTNYKIGDFS